MTSDHILPLIYLDYQATTPVHEDVVAAMTPYSHTAFGNPHSLDHILGWKAQQAVDVASEQLAKLLNCRSDEIVFTSGATEANNQAILGAAIASRETDRNKIIVSATEHKSVLATASAAAELFGISVQIAPVDSTGRIKLDWLSENLDEYTALVSVISVNNEIGTIQDLEQISEMTKQYGILLHSDCAQSPLAYDLRDLTKHLDVASFSGHKFHGPKGIGALFIKHSAQAKISPILFGGGQQNGLRSGTLPTPLVVGMGRAAQLVQDRTIVAKEHLCTLRKSFCEQLSAADIEIELVTPIHTAVHPANANIRFMGIDAQDILQSVQPNLAAATGSACTSGTPEASHVLRAIGLSEEEARQCVRFSFGYQTRDDDIAKAVKILHEAIINLRDFC